MKSLSLSGPPRPILSNLRRHFRPQRLSRPHHPGGRPRLYGPALPLLVWALAAGACTRGGGVRPEAPGALRARDFYPLAVGNRWTYQVREPGPPSGWSTPRTDRRTVEIVAVEDGWFRDSQRARLRVDSLGLRDPDRYLLREPLAEGTRWSNVISLQSTERYEIIEAGRPCTVSAGTFGRCVRVRATNRFAPKRELASEWTYAEGVGLVQMHTALVTDGRSVPQIELELVSFQFAP